jgi:hypothetical protein
MFAPASMYVATGGLVTDDWQQFAWPKIRYLEKHFNLQPWYSDTNAFLASVAAQQQDAVKARITADAAAAKEAAAAAAAAAANPALNLTTITETVVPVRAAGDTDTSSSGSKGGTVSPGSSALGADLLPAATPAGGATAGAAAAQPVHAAQPAAAAPGQQGGSGDAASYVHFDVQPPPAIVIAGAGGAASSKPAAAAAAGSSIKQLSQAVKPPALVQHVGTHANLPAPVIDLEGTPGSAMLLDVPATVEEEQMSVPATVQEAPA